MLNENGQQVSNAPIYGEYCEYGYRICSTKPDKYDDHDICKFGNNRFVSEWAAMVEPESDSADPLDAIKSYCEIILKEISEELGAKNTGASYCEDMKDECSEYFNID